MNDLVSGTGLNKHSMYQEFGSKEGLFRECIDNFALKTTREVNIILNREPLGLGNIEAFFRNRIDYASSCECSGCMMVNTAIEKELIDGKAFAQVQKYFSRHEEAFYRCLVAAQAEGELTAEKDCRVLAGFLFTFATGTMVMSKTNPSRASLEARVKVALSIIKV